jgi:hypothetical protein
MTSFHAVFQLTAEAGLEDNNRKNRGSPACFPPHPRVNTSLLSRTLATSKYLARTCF